MELTLARLIVSSLVVLTLLPLLNLGQWYVRICDFFRPQIVALAVASILGISLWNGLGISLWNDESSGGWSAESFFLVLVAGVVIAWQTTHIIRFTPLVSKQIADSEGDKEEALKVAVVNLKFENPHKAQVLAQLEELNVDLLLLIEVDEPWAKGLAPLQARFPHRMGVVRGEGLGLQLWSKLPLENPQVMHLVSQKRASLHTTVRMQAGKRICFVGLHPLPPGLPDDQTGGRHDSRIRDAELMQVAEHIAKHPDALWLVTGDFNDVAWSHTTRMFQRVSRLGDPRVGRGLYNTYHAGHWWLRFPIDQIFVSMTARIHSLTRFRPQGSDHFAIVAKLDFQRSEPSEPLDPPDAADSEDQREASEMIEEGRQDAAEHHMSADGSKATRE